MSKFFVSVLIVGMLLSSPQYVYAGDEYVLKLENHHFSPQELTIPAGTKIRLTVKNLDPMPAEFESSDLNREKVIGAHSKTIVFVGPLDAGKYKFFDDFHRDTTGTLVAK